MQPGLTRAHAEPETAYTLPSRYFYDPEIFAEEKRKIFYQVWHLAGHRTEIPEPGDYIVCDIFEQGVIVVRGHDRQARAFHNVCQHRGHRLLEDRRGRISTAVICPYHAWSYGLDGALRSAGRSDHVKGFEKAAFGLKPVRLDELAGFLFVNLDPDAQPMAETMAGADAAIRASWAVSS